MKSIKYLINAVELGKGPRGWADPRAAHAELTRVFRALNAAFPGAHVNVTTHPGETVLHVSGGLDRARVEEICRRERSHAPSSQRRSPSSPRAAATPSTAAERAGTEE